MSKWCRYGSSNNCKHLSGNKFYDVFVSYTWWAAQCVMYQVLLTVHYVHTVQIPHYHWHDVTVSRPLHVLVSSCWSFSQLKFVNSVRIIVRWFWQALFSLLMRDCAHHFLHFVDWQSCVLYILKVSCAVRSVQHLVSLLVGQCKLLSLCAHRIQHQYNHIVTAWYFSNTYVYFSTFPSVYCKDVLLYSLWIWLRY